MSILEGASGVVISEGTLVAVGNVAAGSIVNIGHGGVSSGLNALSAAAAHTAMHDSSARFDAPRCHRNTRAKYRTSLERWMLGLDTGFDGKQLIWLHGGAGAGKSAIMQSVVEQCTQHGAVLGSFFFSRADSSRNYAEVLIPTLAYQVARAFPGATTILDPILQRDPLIFKASLLTQAVELLVRPLLYLFANGIIDNSASLRRVFVIDGLDECSDANKQALIIRVIASIICDHHLPVCFLIASRPEVEIGLAFEREKALHSTFLAIDLTSDDDAKSDIRQFIEDNFQDIVDSHPWRKHIELPWPHPGVIDHLVRKSSSHFIYAATVIRFIASSDEHPERALKVVLGLEPSRTGSPFADLDALYMHILMSARYSKEVLEIIRHLYLSRFGPSVASVCFVLNISPEDVSLFLSDVQSLLSLIPDKDGVLSLSPKHASLGDFVQDKARSHGLYMSSKDYQSVLLPRYFQLLDNGPTTSLATLYIPCYQDKVDTSPNTPLAFPYISSTQDKVDTFIEHLVEGLQCSDDAEMVHSLVATHSSYDIWNFYVQSMAPNTTKSSDILRIWNPVTRALCFYLRALRSSCIAHNDAVYIHQLKVYIEQVLNTIIGLVDKKPQYCIIPALIFLSGPSILVASYLLYWDDQFKIGTFSPSIIFDPLDLRDTAHMTVALEAIRQMPQSQLSWTSDLTFGMKFILQELLHLLGQGPSILRSSPHKQWLQRHKPLKHVSLGSPWMSSATSHHMIVLGSVKMRTGTKKRPFLLSCWRKIVHDSRHTSWQPSRIKCEALLNAVIYYLPKCDCTNDIVVLARKFLPMVTLWHPKLMKRARAEMDAYVCRWEESPQSVLEMTKSLHINDMD